MILHVNNIDEKEVRDKLQRLEKYNSLARVEMAFEVNAKETDNGFKVKVKTKSFDEFLKADAESLTQENALIEAIEKLDRQLRKLKVKRDNYRKGRVKKAEIEEEEEEVEHY